MTEVTLQVWRERAVKAFGEDSQAVFWIDLQAYSSPEGIYTILRGSEESVMVLLISEHQRTSMKRAEPYEVQPKAI